jgi:hypothetical protein
MCAVESVEEVENSLVDTESLITSKKFNLRRLLLQSAHLQIMQLHVILI